MTTLNWIKKLEIPSVFGMPTAEDSRLDDSLIPGDRIRPTIAPADLVERVMFVEIKQSTLTRPSKKLFLAAIRKN